MTTASAARSRALFTAAWTLAIIPGLVQAQAVAADTATAPEAGNGGGLEEIVVTAQKRSENAQSVPIPISTLGPQMLQNMRIEDSTQLSQFVPGLNIQRANVTAVPFLRGIGNTSANPGNEPPIATYVDDVYLPSPSGSNFAYNNIGHIEVLKGPQGTLFGRNAAGGVINISTRDPSATPELDVSVGYANYNTVSTDLYGSTGLTDTLTADLAAHYEDQGEGWGRNLLTGKDVYLEGEKSFRSKWIWKPADGWRVRFIADFDDTHNDVSSVLNIYPGTVNLFGATHQGSFFDQNSYAVSRGENKQSGFSVRIDHDLGWATAASISSWRRAYSRGQGDNTIAAPAPYFQYDITGREDDGTQEFQLASLDSSTIKWIAGLYYFYDRAGERPLSDYGYGQTTHPGAYTAIYDMQHTRSYAAYTQATTPLGWDTRLTLGLRYTYDKRDINAQYLNNDGSSFNTVPNMQKTFGKLTYRAALDHDIAKDVIGYASYDLGFKSGYFATGNPAAPVVGPETLSSYQLGIKSEILDHTLRLNAAAFFYQFRDMQVQQIVTINGIATGLTANAASANLKGVDMDATWQPTSNLTVVASAAWLDTKFNQFDNATFQYPCISATTAPGCRLSVNGGGYYQAIGAATGNDLPLADKGTADLTGIYKFPSAIGVFSLVGSVGYHNGYYFDVQNTLRQPAYTLVDSSLTWTSNSGEYDVTLWGKNLTNEHYFAQLQRASTVTTYSGQAPLTFGLKAGWHFGK
jgi:iron complex outermembrane recepter protein